jgi:nitrile hydratase
MNGVHDMGGMHGMGPVEKEENEPVFHTRWEARVFALTRAMGAWRKWNIDASRHERELIPAADYMRMSYYEKWIAGLESLIVKHGLATRTELETSKPDPKQSRMTPPLRREHVAQMIGRGVHASRSDGAPPRFAAGQHVRARNINPTGHTRLPRYTRGKVGLIVRDHGVFVFPDTNAHFQGETPQHVYSVRFTARELWGDGASERDSVYVDLWDDYLERA